MGTAAAIHRGPGRLVSALFCAVLASADAAATTLFQSTQSGAQLAANPNVVFDNPGTVVGDVLHITRGSVDRIFVWNFLGAAPRNALTITIDVDYVAVAGDQDPTFGLTDGTTLAGWERSNNNGGSWWLRDGAFGTAQPNFNFIQGGLGALEPFTMTYSIGAGAPDHLTIVEGADLLAGFAFTVAPLDSDAPLAFAWFGQGGETYGIRSLAISVETTVVPLPAALPLLLAGVAGLAALTRRTHAVHLA